MNNFNDTDGIHLGMGTFTSHSATLGLWNNSSWKDESTASFPTWTI